MTHTYHITGMTCTSCQEKVKSLLANVTGVTNVSINLQQATADITMDKHIATTVLQTAFAAHPKYHLTDQLHQPANMQAFDDDEENKPFLVTYKPVLLIFGYVTLVSVLITSLAGGFVWMLAMRVFMAGFFLTFSFFKMLDLNGFADSYSGYDIIAKRFRGWAYVYAFVELALGLAYATGINPPVTGWVTLFVMSLSIIGVLQSVLNKRKIKCACLGAVFNLPMSTVTIIEDGLMIAMSAAMLIAII